MIDYLTPQQANILTALSMFKFMGRSHFIAYGIAKPNPSIYNNLSILREKKLVNRYSFATVPKHGRMEDLYSLTERGARIVSENLDIPLEKIKYPSRATTEFKNDYNHRVATINTMVSFVLWANSEGYEVDFFDTYYDKVGSQKKSETGVQSRTRLDLPNDTFINTDANIRYIKNNQSYLFCIEVYNGKDTKRINEQLRKLTFATFEGIPSKKYNHSKANRNLIILEHESYIQYAIDRLKNDSYLAQFEGIEKFYFFNSLSNIKNGFGDLWLDLEGKIWELSNL
jgi:hypothetical protein